MLKEPPSNTQPVFTYVQPQNLLDLNKDGKVDSKDLEYGFDKVKMTTSPLPLAEVIL